MTVEEIEILVTAKVEEAVKEFQNMVPTIKQAIKQVQESITRVDMKSVQNKVHQAVVSVKKKLQDLKKSNQNNEVSIKINNKEAIKQVSQLQKEIDSLQKKISEREMKINITNGVLDKMRETTRQNVSKEMPDAGFKRISQQTELRLFNDDNYVKMVNESDKLNNEIIRYNALLDSAKSKMTDLENEINSNITIQSKMSSFFSMIKQKIEQVKTSVSGFKNNFKEIPKITQNITNNIKNMGNGLKGNLKHVLKYAAALFSLRGIYSVLSNSARSWLSSQNAGAQQLSANIEYMKYAMGSMFAPVIEYVINLVYRLMKAIQSLAYAFTGVNIFAKATASSMKNVSGSAKQTSKSLSGIHSEINNVSDNKNSSGSGRGTPNIDFTDIDKQISPISQKLYEFFKPLVDSWKTYGTGLIKQIKTTASQVFGLISSVWGSFQKIITNGSAYSILENILSVIGNIAEAFSNAWNNNGNGDIIIQNLANAINSLLDTINILVESPLFQGLLDGLIESFKVLSECIKFVAEKLNEFIGFFTGDNSEKLSFGAILIGSIATAIGLVCAAIIAYNVVAGIAAVVTAVLTSPITLVIAAIAGLIAIIIICIQYWDEIKSFAIKCWEGIKETWEKVANWFNEKIIQPIKNFFTGMWDNLMSGAKKAWEGIKSVFSTVVNFFKTIFTKAWTAVKNVFSVGGKIFDGIKEGIVNCFKTIVNGIIRGINKVVSIPFNAINNVLSRIRNINILGVEPFTWIHTFNVPQIPELAKGNVAYNKTLAIFGEYSGASSNPEITAPQNIMRETFEDVLSNYNNENSDRPINLTVNVGNAKLGQILLDNLRDMKRQTGKNIEALVGG